MDSRQSLETRIRDYFRHNRHMDIKDDELAALQACWNETEQAQAQAAACLQVGAPVAFAFDPRCQYDDA